MKIRSGFVSNSSSSSFIVNDYNIKDCSKSIFKTVIKDWSEWSSDRKTKHKKLYDKWKNNLTKALKNKEVINGTIGIKLPSSNYDTFLILKEGKVYIDTCCNHSWRKIDEIAGAASGPGEGFKLDHNYSFFDVKLGKVICPIIKNGTNCKYCNYDEVYISEDGKKYCSICDKEIKSKLLKSGKA